MLEEIPAQEIVRGALRGGGDFADLFFEESRSVVIVCEEDRIEKVISGVDIGVGLRVLLDLRTLYAFTNRITREDLTGLAEEVRRAAGKEKGRSVMDFTRHRPAMSSGAASLFASPVDRCPDDVPMGEKISVVRRANDMARRGNGHVRQVKVFYRDFTQNLAVVNSEGNWVEGKRTGTLFSVQVVSAEGDLVQTGYEAIGGITGFELFDVHPPEEVAEVAARRSRLMLSARKAPMGRMPVVLSSEAGGTMIHEAIGHGLEADLAQQGLSVFSKKVGEKVASPLITVVDDPTLPQKRGSYAFDDEGVTSRKTVLVQDGILKGYLYDRLTAMKDGTGSTGNGRRESYRNKPIPRMSNTLILPGTSKPEEIIRSVEKGLLVRKMGGGQVNTVNGDFVFEVSEGYLIENGCVTEPIRGAILTGNGPQVLREIDRVGDDLGFGIGTCGKEGQGVPVSDAQPTLRIPEIVVGGQHQGK
jgi:TldD protein